MSADIGEAHASTPLVQRVAAHIKARFSSESSGHDWHHIHRVWKLARQIAGDFAPGNKIIINLFPCFNGVSIAETF